MIEKARREVDATIKHDGERAVLEAGVHNIHPELVRLLGRLRYRTSTVRMYLIIHLKFHILQV